MKLEQRSNLPSPSLSRSSCQNRDRDGIGSRDTLCTSLNVVFSFVLTQIHNEDLRTKLEYFSEDYDEEREMEPRPEPRREATPTLRLRSLRVHRQRERVVGFEDAPNNEGNRRGRNVEGIRPSEIETREGENRGVNLPPPLAAHLGRNKNSQPLRSSLTSVQGGHQPLTNIGGNLPPNGMLLSHHAQPFIPSSLHIPIGLLPTPVNPYS
ncbi:hypothetical protein Tco_0637437 [Tanacetum coccineum]